MSVPALAADPLPPADTTANRLPFPDLSTLTAELALKPAELPGSVADFAEAVEQGKKSKAYTRICAKKSQAGACRVLTDYYSEGKNSRFEKRVARLRRPRPLRLKDERDYAKAQKLEFGYLVQALKMENEATFNTMAASAMRTSECPRQLSAALTIRAEEFYPSETARDYSRQLFQHARQCMTADESSYERVFLRQGLYAYSEGDKDRAYQLLTSASQAKSLQEGYRTLYWMGRIANERGTSHKENADWQKLIATYPLSYYAIDASTRMGEDPISVITNRRLGSFKRAVEGDDDLNTQIRWLEALYIYKKYNAVGKWASWVVRAAETLDVDVLHYLSALKIASGLYRSNINMMFSYFKQKPTDLNLEAMKLLYPRPFFHVVHEASRDKIDTFLVIGLVRQESAFDPRAKSHANARGLMQLIPQTARRLASGGAKKLYDEEENTLMGVKYLTELATRFDGRMELVLAGYNAGPNRVDEWLKRNERKDPLLWNDLIPFMETRDYVVSILRNNYFYARLYGYSDLLPRQRGIYHSTLVQDLLAGKAR